MDRIDSLALWMPVKNTAYRPEHMMHPFSEVLPTMCDYEDLIAIAYQVEFRMGGQVIVDKV